MKTILMILGLAGGQDERCDSVHGVGCVRQETSKCASCGGATDREFVRCTDCALKEGRCVCGKKREIHAFAAEFRSSGLLAVPDVYSREIEAISKYGFNDRKREDEKVEYRAVSWGAAPPARLEGKTLYVRFVKIYIAGGPPGKYEGAILARRIQVASWMEATGPSLQVNAGKGRIVRVVEPACKACKISESVVVGVGQHRLPIEVPAVALDHGFEVHSYGDGQLIRSAKLAYRDGKWLRDGKAIEGTFLFQ